MRHYVFVFAEVKLLIVDGEDVLDADNSSLAGLHLLLDLA
jgi:hypothetical protein